MSGAGEMGENTSNLISGDTRVSVKAFVFGRVGFKVENRVSGGLKKKSIFFLLGSRLRHLFS